MVRIDDRALVPIGWVLSGVGVVVAVSVIGAFWVSSVDYRLGRIEEHLGIPPLQGASANPIRSAFGDTLKEKHAHTK